MPKVRFDPGALLVLPRYDLPLPTSTNGFGTVPKGEGGRCSPEGELNITKHVCKQCILNDSQTQWFLHKLHAFVKSPVSDDRELGLSFTIVFVFVFGWLCIQAF